jgi:glycosyltransferase involved in cell wall biosynthesis
MYREAGRIRATVEALDASSVAGPGTEFLFVDDGSDDGTPAVAEDALATSGLRARLLRLDRNGGKGTAVREGIQAAVGDVVAFVDADLSAGTEEIERCLRVVEGGEADIAVASRAHAQSFIAVPQPPLRQLSGKAFNRIIRLIGLTTFPDTQCGLKVFRGEVASELFSTLTITGFSFDVEILDRAVRRGYRIVEVPVIWKHVEESRVRPFRHSSAMLVSVIAYRVRLALDGRTAHRAVAERRSIATAERHQRSAPSAGP